MYATTFPCHSCARHLVAAGIRRLVYVEPYPKSLALELHSDAIDMESAASSGAGVVVEPFVGLAPRLYEPLFRMVKRKDGGGKVVSWDAGSALPRLAQKSPVYLADETGELEKFLVLLESKRLSSDEEVSS